jgi:REP element-mobilizing transposase RayT
MTRPLRIEYPGAVYHITARGDGRRAIFRDDVDRERFLEILLDTVSLRKWVCHAYCLMDNHYHLLIETPEPNLSRGMRSLNGEYTQAFNRRHRRPGHVFQGRYKSVLVEKERHLLELCRYVVLNPVRARGMAKRPGDWVWSSYRATAGLSPVPHFLSPGWILARFGRNRKAARERYRAFVAAGRSKRSPLAEARGGIVLGGDALLDEIRPAITARRGILEHPRGQRHISRPPLEALFPEGAGPDRALRNAAIIEAFVEHGYKLEEIGRQVSLHYATVCRIIRQRPSKK